MLAYGEEKARLKHPHPIGVKKWRPTKWPLIWWIKRSRALDQGRVCVLYVFVRYLSVHEAATGQPFCLVCITWAGLTGVTHLGVGTLTGLTGVTHMCVGTLTGLAGLTGLTGVTHQVCC